MTTVYKMLSDKTKFFYIGCTTRKLNYRYSDHKANFKRKDFKVYRKIKSLGLTIDDFRLEEISEFENKKEGLELEHFIITENADNPYILNHTHIEDTWNLGTTHEVSQETRDKISKANKGQVPYSKGKKQPREHTDKIRQALTGRKLSKEHVESIRKSQVGVPKSFNTVTCPKCGKIGKDNVMHKWHFDNCRYNNEADRVEAEKKKPLDYTKIVSCPHCGKEGKYMGMNRWHFDNCKEKVS